MIESNYGQAGRASNDMFENEGLLASSNVNKFIDYKPHEGKVTIKSLKSFLQVINEKYQLLSNNIPDQSDFILFASLSVRCLDSQTRQAFEMVNVDVDYPSGAELVKFVKNRCQAMELSLDPKF